MAWKFVFDDEQQSGKGTGHRSEGKSFIPWWIEAIVVDNVGFENCSFIDIDTT